MSQGNKPKLRMAPSATTLSEQQEAAARLLKLDSWTEEPSNPPIAITGAVAASDVPAIPPVLPEPIGKPWERPGSDASHPYHLVCSEGLFQKIDFVWKRNGNKSMREWVLATLEAEANAALKKMGEL